MLTIEQVSHHYRSENGDSIEALASTHATIQDGEFVCMVGQSGCGKSTLLKIIAGLIHPTSGKVSLHGTAITKPIAAIGMIFQQANLMPWRTVLANVELPLQIIGVSSQERQQRARAILAKLGLSDFEQAFPAELSGGMAQRVAIARTLAQNPQVLLLDEPFAALDALTREQMLLDLMTIWANERKTIIKVTHGITDAVLVADRVFVMSPRPGTIRTVIPIDLPRPRTLDMIHHPTFGVYVQQIREKIEG